MLKQSFPTSSDIRLIKFILPGNFNHVYCYYLNSEITLCIIRDGTIYWYITVLWYIKTVIQYQYKFKSHHYIEYCDILTYWYQYIQYCIHICDWIWEKLASTHIYKYIDIQFWNIKYNISWECKELLVCLSLWIHSYTMSFSWSTLQRTASWIACHFR